MLAAIQFYFTYPETANKSLEEIEILFSPAGPRPWHTKPGGSRLDVLVNEAREKQYTLEDVQNRRTNSVDAASTHSRKAGGVENVEKV